MIILNVSKKNNENKRLNQQEDVECEDAELTINTPMFIPSSSRYDSNTSVESSAIINIPNQTRNRKQDTFSNSFICQSKRNIGLMSRNPMIKRKNPMFRTFEESLPENM